MSSPAISYALIRRPEVPPIRGVDGDQSHAALCRQMLHSQIRYYTTKRTELERIWNRARLYDAAKQWLRPLLAWGGSRYWFTYEPVKVTGRQDTFPRPVRNIFSSAMQDETARLVGVGSKPYVRVDDDEAEDGALLAKRGLVHRNDTTGWEEQNRLGCWHMPLFGQWIEVSKWATSKLLVIEDPVGGATHCPHCDGGVVMASPSISPGQAANFRGPVQQLLGQGGQESYQVDKCPSCSKAMEPYNDMPESLWKGGQDALGRPLSNQTPQGEDLTEVVTPYSFFPQNQGVGYQTADDMREFTLRTPRTLEYFEEHYDNGHAVKSERQFELFRHHPVLTGSYGLTIGSEGIWDNHNLEDIYVSKPTVKFPRGRMIAMAGNLLLFDGELMIPGTDIPRIECDVAQWEQRDNELWGKSLSEDLFSVQDNTNSTLSLAMDVMGKHVQPKMILHEGMHLSFAGGARSPYAGDIWTLQTRGLPDNIRDKYPMMFGGDGPNPQVWQMLDRDRDFVPTATGAHASETGDLGGAEIKNYSALLFAAQKSATRRKPRQAGLRGMKRRRWTHRLRMMAALWSDERVIRYKDDAKKWHLEKVRGMQFKGQTGVMLEEEPVVDTGTATRAAIAQAREWGTLRTSMEGGSFSTDRKINRSINLPEELNEDRNIQDDLASDEFKRFFENSMDPAVDPTADNHQVHFNAHNLSLDSSTDAKELKRALEEMGVPWAKIIHTTWEWERMLADLEQRVMMVRNAPDPQTLMQTLVQTGEPPDAAMAKVQQMMQQVEKMKQSLQGFPPALELRIYAVWMRLIDEAQLVMRGGEEAGQPVRTNDVPVLRGLVRFNAHRLAHWRLMQGMVSADAQPQLPPGPPEGGPAGPVAPGGAPPGPMEPPGPGGAMAGTPPAPGGTQATAAPGEASAPS